MYNNIIECHNLTKKKQKMEKGVKYIYKKKTIRNKKKKKNNKKYKN